MKVQTFKIKKWALVSKGKFFCPTTLRFEAKPSENCFFQSLLYPELYRRWVKTGTIQRFVVTYKKG